MKKVSMIMICLAGLSFLVGVLMKLSVMPHLLGTVPSTWIQLTMVFLLASIAMGLCKCDCKCGCGDKE